MKMKATEMINNSVHHQRMQQHPQFKKIKTEGHIIIHVLCPYVIIV